MKRRQSESSKKTLDSYFKKKEDKVDVSENLGVKEDEVVEIKDDEVVVVDKKKKPKKEKKPEKKPPPKKSPSKNQSQRVHNKSGKVSYSILSDDDKTIKKYYNLVLKKAVPMDLLIKDSKCLLLSGKNGLIVDGRLTVDGNKVGFGYQYIAFFKFGRDVIKNIPTSKIRSDLVISHLCGRRNCCNSDHLILEEKWINDERTHCHFVLNNIKEKSGWKGIEQFFILGGCQHNPLCCSLNTTTQQQSTIITTTTDN